MAVATLYEHITLNDAGVAYIKGTTTKVIQVVLDYKAHGWSPEEIHYNHPYLSMGQIHSAFGYYWDHLTQLDQEIRDNYEEYKQLRQELETPDLRRKLVSRGLL